MPSEIRFGADWVKIFKSVFPRGFYLFHFETDYFDVTRYARLPSTMAYFDD